MILCCSKCVLLTWSCTVPHGSVLFRMYGVPHIFVLFRMVVSCSAWSCAVPHGRMLHHMVVCCSMWKFAILYGHVHVDLLVRMKWLH